MKKVIISEELESPKKNKKWMIIVGVVALVLIGFFLIKNMSTQKSKQASEKANKQPIASSNTLLEQYKNDLPNLQKKADSNNSNDLQNYAVAQYATGNVAGAEDTYKKQIGVDKNNAVAHNNLANALRDQGKFEEAIQEYTTATKTDPKAITSYINLANLYQYSLGKKDEAVAVYKDAITQNKDAIDIYVLLAGTYESMGSKDLSEEYFQKALDIQPENVAAKNGLERLKK